MDPGEPPNPSRGPTVCLIRSMTGAEQGERVMSEGNPTANLAGRFYLEPAAAFVRHTLPDVPDGAPEELVRLGLAAGLRLHRFKRTADLPRVRKVLGILHGL